MSRAPPDAYTHRTSAGPVVILVVPSNPQPKLPPRHTHHARTHAPPHAAAAAVAATGTVLIQVHWEQSQWVGVHIRRTDLLTYGHGSFKWYSDGNTTSEEERYATRQYAAPVNALLQQPYRSPYKGNTRVFLASDDPKVRCSGGW